MDQASTEQENDPLLRKVRTARDNAMSMMSESGYDIGQSVRVRVDPNLPFMGYTMPTNNGTFTIVVAGNAVESGMLEGLLIHEMSHVYRIRSQHPSHNANIIENAITSFGKSTSALDDQQQKILHDILNDIQDLYADDIAFQIFRKHSILSKDQMTGFLQSWVKNEPVSLDDSKDGQMSRWINGSILVHNARALAQMQRHKISDKDGIARQANDQFLSQMPLEMTRNFQYFQNVLTTLPENLTPETYDKLLTGYIGRFLEIIGERESWGREEAMKT